MRIPCSRLGISRLLRIYLHDDALLRYRLCVSGTAIVLRLTSGRRAIIPHRQIFLYLTTWVVSYLLIFFELLLLQFTLSRTSMLDHRIARLDLIIMTAHIIFILRGLFCFIPFLSSSFFSHTFSRNIVCRTLFLLSLVLFVTFVLGYVWAAWVKAQVAFTRSHRLLIELLGFVEAHTFPVEL